ncbi:asparagine synthase-related protein [Sinorhizobium psoraleae]|uniref:asparagine synthase-related protein n=1 Tax=Sinorhizobium psoraleae TaxID=520838 RepID=UPI0035E3DE79
MDLLPQSVVQRAKSAYPIIQDVTYDRMLRTRFTALLNDRNAAVAPLLSVDRSRALLNATDNLRQIGAYPNPSGFPDRLQRESSRSETTEKRKA